MTPNIPEGDDGSVSTNFKGRGCFYLMTVHRYSPEDRPAYRVKA